MEISSGKVNPHAKRATSRKNKDAITRSGVGVRWINIVRPEAKDIEWLGKKFKFHRLILEELKGPSARAKVERNKNYLYFIYYFPVYDPKEQVSKRSEIDFLVTKKEVITVSYEKIEVLEELKKSLDAKDANFDDALWLLHKIFLSLLTFQQRQLVHMREKVEIVGTELFRERERERERNLLQKISYVKRDISQYGIIVRPQKHTLETLFEVSCEFFGPSCRIYLNDLIGEHMKIVGQLDDYRQAIEDFESTNNQLINLKNIQVTKTFTILAFLTFPMMLFAAIFSMNVKDTPLSEHPYGFWIVLAIMITAMGGMFAYFRKKDWI